ncbi:carbonic anhydrase family protein [Actinosynnema sp. NPDC020468]|uniref:carbonic anhydrase family protein n=1 Tax=Actinosynnema sp. NPDC020468 TaxID=3154488 RepID=UPI0033F021AA
MVEQQSPVNLRGAVSTPDLRRRLKLGWVEGRQRFAVDGPPGGRRFRPVVEQWLDLEDRSFRLDNVHFHRPSEHWVEGSRHTAELHAVHVRAADVLEVCTVAVFLECAAVAGPPAEPPEVLDLRSLLPERQAFYRYEGSLTTPDFAEQVSWVVFKQPVPVADPALVAFLAHAADPARNPQPLRRRFVLDTF